MDHIGFQLRIVIGKEMLRREIKDRMEVVYMHLKQKNFLLKLYEKSGSWLNRKTTHDIFILAILYLLHEEKIRQIIFEYYSFKLSLSLLYIVSEKLPRGFDNKICTVLYCLFSKSLKGVTNSYFIYDPKGQSKTEMFDDQTPSSIVW